MISIENIKKCSQILFTVVLLLTIAFISFLVYRGIKSNDLEYTQTHELINVTKRPKIVLLLWTWPLRYSFPLNRCPPEFDASDCLYTIDRDMYSSAHAVIIHHRNISTSKTLLPQIPRPPNQFWIWSNMESPSNSLNLVFLDNLINLTMSYRVDSDIPTPYGWLVSKNQDSKKYIIPKKSKLVAWMVSNWKKNSRRVKYYEDLKNYLNIDVFGKYHKPLSRTDYMKNISTYKFYLSFENSIHEDYITEKFWNNAFVSGAVPIVLGPPRKNYERFAPPESFIHVDDFNTTKELASYILDLDKNYQKYQQYFVWKSKYEVSHRGSFMLQYCKVCRALKEAPGYRTIPSIAEWFK
ncbi:galactoside 3(4)-L-fucosyltransferase-like [Pelobates cultripes]|uniref:Fucosyltransferase n=1 Tax=Pelobates cultripes TaxID=61616 RepID=A0AAD1WWM4_PELCU|nr:galactoside 3(4)-L-fucosyltransferase-like [Pelobates cultripes]